MKLAARRSEVVSTVVVVLLVVLAVFALWPRGASRPATPAPRRRSGRPAAVGDRRPTPSWPRCAAAAALARLPGADRRAAGRPAGRRQRALPRRARAGRPRAGRWPAGRPCSTSGRPGARRAARELPALAEYAGPARTRCRCSASTSATIRGPRWPCWTELDVRLPVVADPDDALRAGPATSRPACRCPTWCGRTAACAGSTRRSRSAPPTRWPPRRGPVVVSPRREPRREPGARSRAPELAAPAASRRRPATSTRSR